VESPHPGRVFRVLRPQAARSHRAAPRPAARQLPVRLQPGSQHVPRRRLSLRRIRDNPTRSPGSTAGTLSSRKSRTPHPRVAAARRTRRRRRPVTRSPDTYVISSGRISKEYALIIAIRKIEKMTTHDPRREPTRMPPLGNWHEKAVASAASGYREDDSQARVADDRHALAACQKPALSYSAVGPRTPSEKPQNECPAAGCETPKFMTT
jgi:hypothetical protein